MSAVEPGPPPLRRLLTARAATALMAAYAPLLGAVRCRLQLPDGALHAEAVGPDWRPVPGAPERRPPPVTPERRLLRAGEAAVGEAVCEPPPDGALERAGVDALLASLQRAIDAAVAQRGLAAETLERYREIHLLYRVGEALGGTLDPAAVPRRVLREARGVIDGHGGGVWLAAEAGDGAGLTVIEDDAAGVAVSDPAAGAVGLAALPIDAAAYGEALRARLADPAKPTILAADTGPGVAGVAAHHHLWAPLQVREAVVGGVWLARSAASPVFAAGDAKLLSALATQAGAFLDNARLHQRALAQERMERELQLAYEVQARLMPRRLPDVGAWDLAALWRPAREVSGDFYDLLPVGDAMAVAVADVADKGMPAALFMAVTRSLLRAGAAPGRAPSEVVATANRLASLDASDGMFVTLWYGELRPDGTVAYVNAGHNPPLLIRADGRVERLPRTGILVGWDADAAFGEASVALAVDDLLVAFTDGVTEARDPGGEEFGEARLASVVLAHRGRSSAEVVEAVRAALDAFVADAPTHDDCTLVIAKRRAPTP